MNTPGISKFRTFAISYLVNFFYILIKLGTKIYT